jgi:hypothetical protein
MNAPSLTADQLAAIRRTAAARPHPRLLWDAADRPALLARTADGPGRGMADRLRLKCEAYLDRTHAEYIDLEAYDSAALFNRSGEYVLSRVMEELAFAGWLWNEPRYTARARQIVLRRVREAFLTEAGKDPDYSHSRSPLGIGLTGAPLAATIDLLQPAFTPSEWAEAVAHVRDYYLAYARRPFFERARLHSPGFNKTAYGMCAIGLLALSVAESLPDAELDAAVSEASRSAFGYAREAMDDDGATFEGAGYGAICIHQILQLGEALRRHGLPALSRYEPLHRHGRWVASLLAPGGGTVDLGDSNGKDNVFSSLQLLAAWHDDPVLRWAFRKGLGRPDHRSGPYGDAFDLWLAVLPTEIAWFDPAAPVREPGEAGCPLALHAPDYAAAVFRTGWKDEDLLAVLTGCGRRHCASAHTGAEGGALLLQAFGRDLLFDPGYGYATADAHSTVIVSGKPPAAAGGNANFGGRLTGFAHGEFATCAGVDISQMLGCKWALRDVALLRGALPYLVVADDLNEKDGWAEFDWFWQAVPGARLAFPTAGAPAGIRNGDAFLDISSFAPLDGAYPKPYGMTWFAETHKPEPWAGKPEPPLELPRLRLHLAAYNGLLLTVLVPRLEGTAPLRIRQIACPQPGVALEVAGPGFQDTILFSPYNRFLQSESARGCGRLAIVREQPGRPVSWLLANGYELAWKGSTLVAPRDRAGTFVSESAPA